MNIHRSTSIVLGLTALLIAPQAEAAKCKVEAWDAFQVASDNGYGFKCAGTFVASPEGIVCSRRMQTRGEHRLTWWAFTGHETHQSRGWSFEAPQVGGAQWRRFEPDEPPLGLQTRNTFGKGELATLSLRSFTLRNDDAATCDDALKKAFSPHARLETFKKKGTVCEVDLLVAFSVAKRNGFGFDCVWRDNETGEISLRKDLRGPGIQVLPGQGLRCRGTYAGPKNTSRHLAAELFKGRLGGGWRVTGIEARSSDHFGWSRIQKCDGSGHACAITKKRYGRGQTGGLTVKKIFLYSFENKSCKNAIKEAFAPQE